MKTIKLKKVIPILCAALLNLSGNAMADESAESNNGAKSLFKILNDATNKVRDGLISGGVPTQSNGATSTEQLAINRPARSIRETELFNLYEKYPLESSSEWPRVAITVDSYTWAYSRQVAPDGNECWLMHARIWYSAKQSKKVNPFSVCGHGVDINYTEENNAGRSHFNLGSQFSKWNAGWATVGLKNSGNRRTEGPVFPQKPLPSSPTDTINVSTIDSHLHIILTNMGYDYTQDDHRVWFVKFSNGVKAKGEW